MGLTIRDAESAFLQARATVEEWQAEAVAKWLQPEMELSLIMFWDQMDPVVKANLQAATPQAFAQVDQQIKQLKARQGNG